MITRVAIAALVLAALPLASAAADPRHDDHRRHDERGHGKRKHVERWHHDRGHGYIVEEKRGRHVRRVYVHDRPVQVVRVHRHRVAGPPPWAPAHGWRRKHVERVVVVHDHHPRYVVNDVHLAPAGTGVGRCNRDAIGAVLGGLAGAAAGSAIAGREHRAAGVIGGGVIGILVGHGVGRAMDQMDQVCVGQALEHVQNGERVVWTATGGPRYEVTPTETFQAEDGRYCREYQTTITVGGRAERAYGTACRQPDGQWETAS
jgi:surface antigen